MNYFKQTILCLVIVSTSSAAFSQNYYDKGMQAMLKRDFKVAVVNLEKADVKEPNNPNVLQMLGYSYFQNGDFENSIASYSKLIAVKPNEVSAYYYRGKARLNIANDPKESLNQMREIFYASSIKDFTKAIEIGGDENVQMLQNRAIAYKDYGIFKSYKIKKSADKVICISILNNSVADFQKILTLQPLRKDIIDLIAYVKAQVVSLK
ncbi:tetratricopeptide repeat protein [Pedobacter changchengzhani]|uniref:Tetratricopeptide repeat protein n=1 Tax=Pedobacter changchengzhani TaxID=2529274 RepID=A0A4V2ZZW9_9SPHI|nr:tetratricopeptide repeat protein [Pedobacter changchengzhani]TDG34953.1 tetratricopeptide repeat protein [Pedobacter changchengzhani]